MRRWESGSDSGADGPADEAPHAADAADIEALLCALSELRLSMSADLSAAAGALDAERPDIAADVVAGARRDVSLLRTSAKRRDLAPSARARLVTAGGGGGPVASPVDDIPETADGLPEQRRHSWRGHHAGRVLVGAMALALAVVVGPQLGGGGGGKPSNSAARVVAEPVNLHLVSAEFSTLRSALTARTADPTTVRAAGDRWQQALTGSLAGAATKVAAAKQIVSLLREERTLIAASPAMRKPAMRTAAATLISGADAFLAQLRALATTQVLAVLPRVITALPTTHKHPAATMPKVHRPVKPSGHPSTGATTAPSTGGSGPAPAPTAPLPAPQAPTLPKVRPIPAPPLQLPLPGSSTQPKPLPLPSVLENLTKDATDNLTSGLTAGLSGH